MLLLHALNHYDILTAFGNRQVRTAKTLPRVARRQSHRTGLVSLRRKKSAASHSDAHKSAAVSRIGLPQTRFRSTESTDDPGFFIHYNAVFCEESGMRQCQRIPVSECKPLTVKFLTGFLCSANKDA